MENNKYPTYQECYDGIRNILGDRAKDFTESDIKQKARLLYLTNRLDAGDFVLLGQFLEVEKEILKKKELTSQKVFVVFKYSENYRTAEILKVFNIKREAVAFEELVKEKIESEHFIKIVETNFSYS